MAIPEHVKAGAHVLVKEFTRHNTQAAPALAQNPAQPTPETHRITRRRAQKRLKRRRGALTYAQEPHVTTSPGSQAHRYGTPADRRRGVAKVGGDSPPVRPGCASLHVLGTSRVRPSSTAQPRFGDVCRGETSGPSFMGDVHACGW